MSGIGGAEPLYHHTTTAFLFAVVLVGWFLAVRRITMTSPSPSMTGRRRLSVAPFFFVGAVRIVSSLLEKWSRFHLAHGWLSIISSILFS
ncbi:hypothetical protein NL676_012915 [Syzygium grande]|nr:hypothetical protein NL676_012915 [Syzygium grande]